MGFLGGGEAKTGPLDWQREPIRDIFKRSTMATDRQIKAGPYQGERYAGLNDTQRNGINRLTDMANGFGGELAGSVANASKGNLAAGANFGTNAQGFMGQYGAPGSAADGIVSNVGKFMADPALQGSIDAANRDTVRAFQEGGVMRDHSASAGGMGGSTRAGVEEAIAKRSAMDRVADTSASMRSDAYQRALGTSSDAYFGGADLALQGNQQVGDAGRLGAGMAGDAMQIGGAAADMNLRAGGMLQADQQAQNEIEMQKYGERNGGFARDQLGQLYNTIIGTQSWGTKSGGGDGGVFERALGGGLAIGGAVMGMGSGTVGGQMASGFMGGGSASNAAMPSSSYGRGFY